MRRRVLLLCAVFASMLRYGLFYSRVYKFLRGRPEISTPANSFKRILEGIALEDNGLSAYANDTFHEVPLILWLLRGILFIFGQTGVELFFIFCDIWTALCLGFAAQAYLQEAHRTRAANKKKGWIEDSILTPLEPVRGRSFVVLMYLFNPYTIVCCVTCTTSVLQNALLATAFICYGFRSVVFCVLAGHQTLYSSMLIVPVAMSLARENEVSKQINTRRMASILAVAMGLFIGLLFASAFVTESWDFLEATYGFLLALLSSCCSPCPHGPLIAMRHGLLVGCTLVVCSILGPVMWFLWIHAGSANANFYFAITLVYSTALIFLMTDLLYAYLKHAIVARYGIAPVVDGCKAKITLHP